MTDLRVIHGTFWYCFPVYRNTYKEILDFPPKFKEFILEKFRKFYSDLYKKNKLLEFTLGTDDNISVIAVVHPLDSFSKKIGYTIVKKRIEKQKEGGYHTLPAYMEVIRLDS